MKNLSLILRILAIVAAIAATTLYFISKGKLAEKHDLLTRTQQVLASTQGTLSETQKTLERTESELTTERDKLVRTENTLDGVRTQLANAEQEASRNKRDLEAERVKTAQLETSARQLRSDLSEAMDELTAAKRAENQLSQQVADLEQANSELKFDLEAKSAIADSVLAGRDSGTTGASTSSGSSDSTSTGSRQVLIETTINSVSAGDGLIALNTTPELQFSQGQTIILLQGDRTLGKVQVQSVSDDYAVANILPGSSATKRLASGSTVQILN